MKSNWRNYSPIDESEKNRYPFRKFHVRKPSQERIDETKKRDMASFHYIHAYLTVPWILFSTHSVFSFIHSVIFKFFLVQYFQKIKLTRYPIKHVDHELDEKIPFRPDFLKVYLDFVNIWIRPIVMLLHRYGHHQGSKLAAEYLRYIKLSYNEAYRMYTTCMTTTYRPPCNISSIKRMRRADPHYLCVPSLHITIVCLCFSFYNMLFEREGFTEEEKTKWSKELYDQAVKIGETVLYLKQHSVNCIPAAMYMLSKIAPELFTAVDAINFINNLFETADDVSEEDKDAIQEHIRFMYEQLLLEGAMEEDWIPPVKKWLDSYEHHVPSYAN